jgi:hypothetical protein
MYRLTHLWSARLAAALCSIDGRESGSALRHSTEGRYGIQGLPSDAAGTNGGSANTIPRSPNSLTTYPHARMIFLAKVQVAGCLGLGWLA